MASKGNRRIDAFFTPRGQQEVDPPAKSDNPPAQNEVCDPSNSAHNEHDSTYSFETSASTPSTDFPTYPDLAELAYDDLQNDEVRRKLFEGEWRNSHKFKFPSRRIRDRQRKFTHIWLANNKCLRYSISEDTVCCIYVSDWANFKRLLKLHIQSATHLQLTLLTRETIFYMLLLVGKNIFTANFTNK